MIQCYLCTALIILLNLQRKIHPLKPSTFIWVKNQTLGASGRYYVTGIKGYWPESTVTPLAPFIKVWGQILNSGECDRIVLPCIQFLTFLFSSWLLIFGDVAKSVENLMIHFHSCYQGVRDSVCLLQTLLLHWQPHHHAVRPVHMTAKLRWYSLSFSGIVSAVISARQQEETKLKVFCKVLNFFRTDSISSASDSMVIPTYSLHQM